MFSGSHQSLTVPLVIDKRKCSVTCSEQSICACDSLSNNGIPACACKNGHFVKRKNGKDVCEGECFHFGQFIGSDI